MEYRLEYRSVEKSSSLRFSTEFTYADVLKKTLWSTRLSTNEFMSTALGCSRTTLCENVLEQVKQPESERKPHAYMSFWPAD